MRNVTLIALTAAYHLAPCSFLQIPQRFSLHTLHLNQIHATKFLSPFLLGHRFGSLRLSDSKFTQFTSSLGVVRVNQDPPYLDGLCKARSTNVNDAGGSSVVITDTYFMNVNITLFCCGFSQTLPNYDPYFGSTNVVNENDQWSPGLYGGALFARAETVSIANCYFYAIFSEAPAAAFFARSRNPLHLAALTIRAVTCKMYPWLVKPDAQAYGGIFFGATRRIEPNLIPDAVTDFNISTVYATHCQNQNVQIENVRYDGQIMGGMLLNSFDRIVVNGVNCTNLNGDLNSGVLFASQLEPAATQDATFQYSQIVNSQCAAYGIVLFLFQVLSVPPTPWTGAISASVFHNISTSPVEGTTWNGPVIGFPRWENSGTLTIRDSVFTGQTPILDRGAFYNPPTPVPMHLTLVLLGTIGCSLPKEQAFVGGAESAVSDAGSTYATLGWPVALPQLPDALNQMQQIPPHRLTQSANFTPSNTHWPPTIKGHTQLFALSDSVSAGVIATIFGILSLIAFGFLVYMRRGAANKFHILGKFGAAYDFDNTTYEYAAEEKAQDNEDSDNEDAEADLSYSFEYSYSYDYSYSQGA
jgi:hypothetical protein